MDCFSSSTVASSTTVQKVSIQCCIISHQGQAKDQFQYNKNDNLVDQTLIYTCSLPFYISLYQSFSSLCLSLTVSFSISHYLLPGVPGEGEVFAGPLLKLYIRRSQVRVCDQNILKHNK